MSKPYKKVQDNDFHWYWIPKEILKEFDDWNSQDPYGDDFDPFKYDEYRTGGHPDNVPLYRSKTHKL